MTSTKTDRIVHSPLLLAYYNHYRIIKFSSVSLSDPSYRHGTLLIHKNYNRGEKLPANNKSLTKDCGYDFFNEFIR